MRYKPVETKQIWPEDTTKYRDVQSVGYLFQMSNDLSANGIWLRSIAQSSDTAPVTIVMNDDGREAAIETVGDRITRGEQVLSLDLMFVGNSWKSIHPFLFAQMLDAGAARVVIGSAAVQQADRVQAWLQQFGAERLTLAFDVRIAGGDAPRVAVQGWQRQSTVTLWGAVENFLAHGLKHVLCTDVDRDGALSGPNLDLYASAVQRFPQIQWQASGGIRDAADLRALEEVGAAAAISGKALLEDLIPAEELQPFLRNA